jgi:hypothetical protein
MCMELVKDFAKKNFPRVKMLDYALEVEEVTSSKKDTPMILNVNGCTAICFCDLLSNAATNTIHVFVLACIVLVLRSDSVYCCCGVVPIQ